MKRIICVICVCISVSYFSLASQSSSSEASNTVPVTTATGYQGINRSTLKDAQTQYGQIRNIFYSPYYVLVQNVSGYITDVVYILDKNGKYVAFYHVNNGGGVTRQVLVGTQMVKINGTTYKLTAQQDGILVTDSVNNTSYLVKKGG